MKGQAYITIGEIATDLGVSECTVRRAIRERELPAMKVRHQYRVTVKAYEAYRDGCKVAEEPKREYAGAYKTVTKPEACKNLVQIGYARAEGGPLGRIVFPLYAMKDDPAQRKEGTA